MSVPPSVPPDVPAGAAAPDARSSKRSSRKGNGGTAPHLTGGPGGWRFQMRLPSALIQDSGLAGRGFRVRASLGPRGRGEAKRLARQLATLCESIFALAAAKKATNTMATMSAEEKNLAHQVVAACQAAIGGALKQPAQAIGLARGLNGALTSLLLVQSEVAKGAGGARAVVDHADALTRHALTDVLALSAQPAEALAALAAVPAVAPTVTTMMPAEPPVSPPRQSQSPGGGSLPTFGEISQRHIDMRIRNNAKDSDIQRLTPTLRRELKLTAFHRGTTVQALLLQAIEIVLDRRDDSAAPKGPAGA